MNNISHCEDFIEVPRIKHIKKRLIKSRVLSKLLFSLSRGEVCQSDSPFNEGHISFIQTLSGIQLTELSCILISDFSVDFSLDNEGSTPDLNTSLSLSRIIAKHYIAEWVLNCSNDYRFIYDEHYKGIPANILKELSRSTPLELKAYEDLLVTSGSIIFEFDKAEFEKSILKAKRLFRQDDLIIKAIRSGASLPQAKQFFSTHRLCDSRSVAVLKKLYECRNNFRIIDHDVCTIIINEFNGIAENQLANSQDNEVFLSDLYNFLTSILERFGVSFSDSWNAIRSSSVTPLTRIST